MPFPNHTKASLRIWGDNLVPDEISELLGTTPSASERKGETFEGKNSRVKHAAKTGGWRLDAGSTHDGNLDAQINALFAQLPSDVTLWRDLAARYRIDVFCGVFMGSGNDGLELNSATMQRLGERGASLGLDIYDSDLGYPG